MQCSRLLYPFAWLPSSAKHHGQKVTRLSDFDFENGCTQGGHAAGCRYFLSTGCAFSKFRRQCSRALTYICSKVGSLLNVKGIPFCIGTVLPSFTSVHSIASPFVADILSNKVTFSSQPKYRYYDPPIQLRADDNS